MRILLGAALAVALSAPAAFAAGDLAIKATKIELQIGLGDAGYGVSEPEIHLETGKAYTLELSATDAHECEWSAETLFENVWLRGIEIEHVGLGVFGLEEIEFGGEGEAEIKFVPIRPGTYEWECDGLAEKGLKGSFIVK